MAKPEFTACHNRFNPKPQVDRHGKHFMTVSSLAGAEALAAALNALAAIDLAAIADDAEFARDQVAQAAARVVSRRAHRPDEVAVPRSHPDLAPPD